MSTYTQLLYQIVFCTKHREPTLTSDNREALFKNINAILKNKNCTPYRINGVEDHLHIVTHIHPSISISSIVKDIKLGSSECIKRDGLFKDFNGWQGGYGAFSYSIKDKDRLIEYVKNQQEHHKTKSYMDEYIELLNVQGIEFDEKYLL